MIRASFYTTPDGALTGFSVRGHAGLAESGSDILCAAVSSAVFMAANTVLEVLHITPTALIAEDGEMLLRIREPDARLCRDILLGLKLHLEGLSEQYPERLTVSYDILGG